jgi:hypothetical protein
MSSSLSSLLQHNLPAKGLFMGQKSTHVRYTQADVPAWFGFTAVRRCPCRTWPRVACVPVVACCSVLHSMGPFLQHLQSAVTRHTDVDVLVTLCTTAKADDPRATVDSGLVTALQCRACSALQCRACACCCCPSDCRHGSRRHSKSRSCKTCYERPVLFCLDCRNQQLGTHKEPWAVGG